MREPKQFFKHQTMDLTYFLKNEMTEGDVEAFIRVICRDLGFSTTLKYSKFVEMLVAVGYSDDEIFMFGINLGRIKGMCEKKGLNLEEEIRKQLK